MSAGTLRAARPQRWRRLDGAWLLAGLLLAWEAAGRWTAGVAVTGPLETLAYAGPLLLTPGFWGQVWATLSALLLSFALSAVGGLLLGLVLGLRRFAGDVLEPVLAGFYTIPKVTLYPVVLLTFGLGMGAKVAFGVMHGLVPVTLFTMAAIKTLPATLPRTARSLRLSPGETMRWVLLPACLPQIVGGLRLGFSLQPAGGADRRDVQLPARARLPAGERALAAQRGPEHGVGAGDRGLRGGRQHGDAAGEPDARGRRLGGDGAA